MIWASRPWALNSPRSRAAYRYEKALPTIGVAILICLSWPALAAGLATADAPAGAAALPLGRAAAALDGELGALAGAAGADAGAALPPQPLSSSATASE